MAKAVVPLEAFYRKYGEVAPGAMAPFLHDLVAKFRHEAAKDPKHGGRDAHKEEERVRG